MIRFFSAIRKKLLENNRLRKYLVYAIGEIFLVVIGIMIALQVNSWKDERNKQQELAILFEDTELYIGSVSTWARDFSIRYEKLDSVVTLLQGPKNDSIYSQNPAYTRFLFSDSLSLTQPFYYWISPGMQELIGRKTDFKDNQHPLYIDLSVYEVFSKEVEKVTFEFDEYLKELRLRLVDKAPFLLENDPESLQKSIAFAQSKGWYQYELKKVQSYLRDLIRVMDLQWGAYTALYGRLMLVQHEYSPAELASLFNDIGRTPLQTSVISINEPLKKVSGYKANRGLFLPKNHSSTPTCWLVIRNSTPEPVHLEVILGNYLIAEWTVNSLVRRRVPEGATIRLQHQKNGESLTYTAGKGQYLIVE